MRALILAAVLVLAQSDAMEQAKARCNAEGRVFIEKVVDGKTVAWWCQPK